MKVEYRKRFLKELAQLPQNPRIEVEKFVFEVLPGAATLASIGKIEQMKGYRHFFKVRFGNYRLGLQLVDEILIVEIIAHRKDIYKFFP
ncbi:MAG: type II toxin-antitoxin system RelE/ParE family toxin [Ignavibacteria bacterium]|nr:type II toxin-antitoxin system RelE/ParE family toxin [Ignavibacteria bacterium]